MPAVLPAHHYIYSRSGQNFHLHVLSQRFVYEAYEEPRAPAYANASGKVSGHINGNVAALNAVSMFQVVK